jgi:S-adenosylmethionine synthetase
MISQKIREAIKDIGYEQDGFHWANCNIDVLLHPQSADIAQGVDAAATRTRARATRASCSAMPAPKLQN